MHMDVKAFTDKSYPVVPTQKREPPLAPSGDAFAVLSPLASNEIIDYVEIQTNHYQPLTGPQPLYPVSPGRCEIGKGTLVDIWI
jgi:hypothetical protein